MKTSTALIIACLGLVTVYAIVQRQKKAVAHDIAEATTKGPSAVVHGAVGAVAAAGCSLFSVGCGGGPKVDLSNCGRYDKDCLAAAFGIKGGSGAAPGVGTR